MATKNHATYSEWLQLDLDGELSHAESASLRRHLAACHECRVERRSLEEVDALLREGRIDAPADLRRDIMAALPAAGWETRHPRSWLAALLAVAILGGAAAALVGSTAARLDPTAPFMAAVVAVLELFRVSALAGAGMLDASWQTLGFAVGELLSGSIWNRVAFGLLVVAVDYLLIRMLLRRRPAGVERASRDAAPRDRG